ncbi:MAG: hypothetical protein K8T10_15715 [Candidatus Eremiobacteraeota bacterium]|nr:hypothetical protein [Candidatus Eremiobacteraeota bacterium]
MKNRTDRFIMIVVFFAILVFFVSLPSFATEEKGKVITLKIKYGEKDRSSRDYDILASPEVKTPEGKKVTVELAANPERLRYGFKMELTPRISDKNPLIIIVDIRAWEIRDTKDKARKYMDLTKQTIKVMKGATSVTEIQQPGDRDVLITITPNY